jgi:hypothetical protein
MNLPERFRRCLEDGDAEGLMRLWRHVNPHLPQPASVQEATVAMHHARTQAESMPMRLRAYSHRWLADNGFPSGMPDHLRPRAERMYPRVVEAVGISVKARSPEFKPVAAMIEKAMSDAVMETVADGVRNPLLVKARMMGARRRVIDTLYG